MLLNHIVIVLLWFTPPPGSFEHSINLDEDMQRGSDTAESSIQNSALMFWYERWEFQDI